MLSRLPDFKICSKIHTPGALPVEKNTVTHRDGYLRSLRKLKSVQSIEVGDKSD